MSRKRLSRAREKAAGAAPSGDLAAAEAEDSSEGCMVCWGKCAHK